MAELVYELNKEKIVREDKYSFEKIKNELDNILSRVGLTKKSEGVFEGDLEYAISAASRLMDLSWLMELFSVLKVQFIENGESVYEDALEEYREGII